MDSKLWILLNPATGLVQKHSETVLDAPKNEADFDFDIQIIDAVSADRNATFSLKNPASNASDEENNNQGLKLRVSMAASNIEGSEEVKRRQELSANMKVKVKMHQADMPGGLSNLLSLTTNSLQIEETEDQETQNTQTTKSAAATT